MTQKDEMLKMLDVLTNEELEYETRLEAYGYLLEDCGEIVDEMLERFYKCDGDTAQMLLEIMANYPGNKGVYMALVSYLYHGDDIALFAKLLGKYGDESAVEILKSFAEENELNYNEYMEIRSAVEELGGTFKDDESKFADDMFYRYVKGLDEENGDETSPFVDAFNPSEAQFGDDDEADAEDECGDCHCDDENCHCGGGDECHCDDECHCGDECHCDDECHCHGKQD